MTPIVDTINGLAERWARDTGRQPHASVSAFGTLTSQSTRCSPGAR